MKLKKIVRRFWRDMDARKWDNIRSYFSKNAGVHWPNTGEHLGAEGLRKINSEYPGNRRIAIEKIIAANNIVISIVKITDDTASFHVASFFTFKSKKISSLVEYWGEDGKNLLMRPEEKSDEDEDMDKEAYEDTLPKIYEARSPEIDLGDMPRTAKRSAWTRLFFPDDAV
jgi:hypothetical protein